MRNYSNLFKRAQAWVLAVAILITAASSALWVGALADDASNTKTSSDGKIVAGNYDLTAAEKAILSSGLLIGESHTYKVPTSEDDLISVDESKNEVTVKSYEGTDGYEWKPVSVDIVVGDDVKETVQLDSNGKGTYSYDGNAFSVKVGYELYVDVDEATQETLLNTPAYLVQGLENLEDIASIKAALGLIEEAMPMMVKLTTTGIPVTIFGTTMPVTITDSDLTNRPAIAAIKALNKQMNENESGKLDLSDMIAEYAGAANKLQYLFENGEEMKKAATEMLTYISNIRNSDFFSNQIPSYATLGGGAEVAALNLLLDTLDEIVDGLEAPVADHWSAISEKILNEDFDTDDYVTLGVLVDTVLSTTDISKIEIKNPLLVDTATLQYNMSMWNVNVKVVLNVTDKSCSEIKFIEYASESTTVTLADGATKDEVEQAVESNGIVADALADWADTYVDGKFTVSTTTLPATLGEDIEYVITYTPAYFDVDFAYGENVEYPYGYVLPLEKHGDISKVYDYTINGKYYPQGTLYTVEGDTEISRKEGKPYKDSDLYQIVADNYLKTDKGVSILTSGALFGNFEVDVRYPDNNNKIVTLAGNKLTAEPYDASCEGLVWAAYSYKLSNGTVGYFNSASTVEINESFDSVTVEYRLYFTNFDDASILEIVNLPNALAQEAQSQIDALNRITAQKDNLEMLNSTMVSILAGLIEKSTLNSNEDKDAALKECFGSVLESIQEECMGTENLYLYDIVSAYSDSSDGLRYYYLNNEKVRAEVGKFASYMSKMLGSDDTLASADKIAALETLMYSLPSNIVSPDQVEAYVGKLQNLESTMTSVVEDLKAPNAMINLKSDNLGKLTQALASVGETQGFVKLPEKLHLTDSSIVVVADNKVVITVTVNVAGGKTQTITSSSFNYGATIDSATINALISEIESIKTDFGVVDKYFNTDFNNGVALKNLAGTTAGSETVSNYEFNWTYAEFDVKVPGMATQKVTFNDREIDLVASADPAYRIDYTVDGIKVTDASYTLTVAQLDKLIAGKLEITAKSVYILEEELTNFVETLNASVGNNTIVFALVENNGEFSIVMKIDASAPNALMNSAQGAAVGFVQGGYPYIGVDNNALLEDGKVYLQAIVDALMNSGFGSDTIINVMSSTGKINNMTISGNVISDKALTTYGGKLLETTMQLGTSADYTTNVAFYVTLGSASSQIVELRNLLAGKLSNYFSFTCKDGKASVSLNLPEKAYEAFLAVLLVTNNIDITDIDAVNGEIAVSFINSLIIPLLEGEATVETFENTLEKFGFNLNLSSTKGLEELFNMLKKFYTGATFTYDENGGAADGTLDISAVINSLNIGVLADIIAEKDSGIDVCVDVSLANIGNEYEALYVDINAKGITNKAGLAKNLASQLNNMAGTAVVVLLDDVNADLTFKTTTILNLNGFKVTGDIIGSGNVIIVDSYVAQDKMGTVDGAISGNVNIVSGKYTANVSSFVKNGYVQDENGVVSNEFYNIVKDSEGNITVEINAGLIHTKTIPGIKNLVIDLVCDLLFNGYTYNHLEIDGNLIYDIAIEDLVGLYASSNRLDSVVEEVMGMVDTAQLSTLINTILDDVLDFTAIGKAIETNAPVLSYTTKMSSWDVELVHVADGDYITADIATDREITGTLNVIVTGTDSDKQLLADFMKELGDKTEADVNVNITHDKDDKDIVVGATADANIFVDFSDPDYIVMFSVIIADGLKVPTNADLVAGIKKYYETNDIAALKNAFVSLTSAQVITALKNFAVTDDFADMVASLGLEGTVGSEVAELEKLYDRVGKLTAALVRKADLQGRSGKLSNYINAEGSIVLSKENVRRILDATIFAGYAVIADVELTNANFELKLFGDNVVVSAPEFVEGTGAPEILENEKVAGYKVIYDGMYIVIDAHTNGITVEELMNLLNFSTINADSIGYTFGEGALALTDIIPNGTKLTAVASNAVASVSVEYTIIILGDVNCNGRIESGDSVQISQVLVGMRELDEIKKLAADLNNNGRVDVGDASIASKKNVDWNNYQSRLDKE